MPKARSTDGSTATEGAPAQGAVRRSTRGRARKKLSEQPRSRAAKDAVSAANSTEAKILAVLADRTCLHLSVTEKALRAGVSRGTWYRVTGDPLFRARATAACRGALEEQLGPVLDELAQSALLRGREGHADRALFLELVGFHGPEAEAKPGDEEKSKPAAALTDAELLACFEGREELLPAGLMRRMGKDPDAAFDKKPAGKKAA